MKVNQQLNLQQSGAVLITALIYLLVLSVVGISSMRGTAMEERMASNSWEHSRAFQAAESALLDAGQWFLFQPDLIDSSSDGSTGVWASGSAAQRVVSSTFDWSTVSVPVLRAFLCLIPDDKEHVMEAKAVLELTDADVLAKAIEYDKDWGLDGWTTNSWATDLKEAAIALASAFVCFSAFSAATFACFSAASFACVSAAARISSEEGAVCCVCCVGSVACTGCIISSSLGSPKPRSCASTSRKPS